MKKILNVFKKDNQLETCKFAPYKIYNEILQSDYDNYFKAIKETKKYIYEQCNRKDNTDEILKLYKKQYNAYKHARIQLKDFLISASGFVFTMILNRFSEINLTLNFNLSDSNIIVNIINLVFQLLPPIMGFAFFVAISIYWIKYIIKFLINFSDYYDVYVTPYLCNMMYDRLKSEGFDPPKIPFDNL